MASLLCRGSYFRRCCDMEMITIVMARTLMMVIMSAVVSIRTPL